MIKDKKKIFIASIFLLCFLVVPFFVNAIEGGIVQCGPGFDKECDFSDLVSMFGRIIYILINFLAPAIALLLLIAGGIIYLTSMGDPMKLLKAKTTIVSVVIGAVIIMTAWLVVELIYSGLSSEIEPEKYWESESLIEETSTSTQQTWQYETLSPR